MGWMWGVVPHIGSRRDRHLLVLLLVGGVVSFDCAGNLLTIPAGRDGWWSGEGAAGGSVAGWYFGGGWAGGEGVAGVEPGLFEGVLDAGFDFVGDVAVDLDHVPVEVVAEASGLGDLRDAGGDQPGLVAVP